MQKFNFEILPIRTVVLIENLGLQRFLHTNWQSNGQIRAFDIYAGANSEPNYLRDNLVRRCITFCWRLREAVLSLHPVCVRIAREHARLKYDTRITAALLSWPICCRKNARCLSAINSFLIITLSMLTCSL